MDITAHINVDGVGSWGDTIIPDPTVSIEEVSHAKVTVPPICGVDVWTSHAETIQNHFGRAIGVADIGEVEGDPDAVFISCLGDQISAWIRPPYLIGFNRARKVVEVNSLGYQASGLEVHGDIDITGPFLFSDGK